MSAPRAIISVSEDTALTCDVSAMPLVAAARLKPEIVIAPMPPDNAFIMASFLGSVFLHCLYRLMRRIEKSTVVASCMEEMLVMVRNGIDRPIA